MSFYPQFPPAIYAYHPMACATPDVYAMYPTGPDLAPAGGPVYFDQQQAHHHMYAPAGHPMAAYQQYNKPGYNNRKYSADSGISAFSESVSTLSSSSSGRKTSNTSTISNSSIILEEQAAADKEKAAKSEESSAGEEEKLAPMEEPDEELCEKIVQQVEFYFSDANITKDKFLLKHVKRNKEGFVSLKLISSFKRVKHLSKDWRQVAFAVEKKSAKLEVNDLKTKVRRLEPLPEYDETTPSRTVVALNLPLERPTIEAVAEMFSSCGEIVLVRILRPGNPVPADVKPFANKHPEMTDKVCALIEFERTEFAHNAVKTLHNEEDGKMRVVELTAVPVKTGAGKKDERKKSVGNKSESSLLHHQQHQRRFSHAGLNPPGSEIVIGPRRRISLFHNMKFAPIPEKKDDVEQNFHLNPNAPAFHMQVRPPPHHQRAAPAAAALFDGFPMTVAPWMMRRLEMPPPGFGFAPGVIRSPRGHQTADRSKSGGFQKWCRSRMEASSTSSGATRKPGSKAVPIVAPPKEEADEKKPEEAAKKTEEEEPREEAKSAAVEAVENEEKSR